jgi:outer membrane protein
MTQRTISIALRLATLLLAACAAGAHAQDAPANEVRLGALFVRNEGARAHDISGPFTPPGINLRVGDVTTPYLAFLHHIDANWSLELAGGVPPTVKSYGKGPAKAGSLPFDGQEVGSAKWFAPTLLLDYSFLDPSAPVRPFVGLGVNYTRFYDVKSTAAGDAVNGGPTRTSLSSSWGPAGSLGACWHITREFDVVASYSLARVNSHFRSDTAGVIRTTTIHFNPRAFVIAAGYSF